MKKMKIGMIAGWVSIITNVLLFVVKIMAGFMTGSIALIADAWHTLSDSISSIILLIGLKWSSKPADREHPYGHGRVELVGAITIGILLFIVGGKFMMDSILRLKNHEATHFGMFAIIATVLSIVLKEALAQFAILSGKKIRSKSLVADGWHHRSDAISSIIILIGIFLGKYFWWIDGVLGIFVAVVICYVAYEVFKSSVSSLIGEKPDDELLEQIKSIAMTSVNQEINLHHLHLHQYGHHTELTFHISLPGDISLVDAHNIANEIEKNIKEKLAIDTTIHMEPLKELDDLKK